MRKLIFILIALISFSQAQTIQYIGAPTTTVISRGNFRTDSIFYLPKRTKTPTDTAAFRYQISDSSLYYWTGYQWTKVQSTSSFALVDTTVISTRAYRQKGIDSVQYNVGLKVNISDTLSMLSPYLIGSGTSNYFPKFNSTRSVVNSKLYESNLNLLFNSTTPYLTTSGISTIENNGTSAALYVLKTLDTARAYVSFGSANTMDINNLRAGDIRFYTNATLRGRFQTDGTFRLNSLTGTGSRIVVADDNGVLSATSSATGLVDTTLLSTRAWRQKGLDSLAALEISGSGTTNYVPKFTASRTIGNSLIFDNGNAIGVGSTPNTWANLRPIQINSTSFVGHASLDRGYILSNAYFDGSSLRYVNSNTASRYDIEGSSGSHIWFNAASGTSGNVITFSQAMILNNANELIINTTTDEGNYKLQVNGNIYHTGNAIFSATSGNVGIGTTSPLALLDISSTSPFLQFTDKTTATTDRNFRIGISEIGEGDFYIKQETGDETNLYDIKLYINSGGETLINTTTDAGAYTLQNNGALYNTGSAILAATSGSVGIGTTSPGYKLHIVQNATSGRLDMTNIDRTSPSLIRITNPEYSINASSGILLRVFPDSDTRQGAGIIASGGGNNGETNLDLFVSQGVSTSTSFSALRILGNNGSVGIGTASPTYLLDVNGTVRSVNGANFATTSGNVGIGTAFTNTSAKLDVTSTTQGFLPPRMTTTQRDAISSPAAGLVIYNTTTSKLQVYTTSWTDLH